MNKNQDLASTIASKNISTILSVQSIIDST